MISAYLRTHNLQPERRLFMRALCHMLIDAIDGPCDKKPEYDADGSYEARKTARFMVETCHEDFNLRCECSGLDPEAVSQAYRVGKIDRGDVEHAFRMLELRERPQSHA